MSEFFDRERNAKVGAVLFRVFFWLASAFIIGVITLGIIAANSIHGR